MYIYRENTLIPWCSPIFTGRLYYVSTCIYHYPTFTGHPQADSLNIHWIPVNISSKKNMFSHYLLVITWLYTPIFTRYQVLLIYHRWISPVNIQWNHWIYPIIIPVSIAQYSLVVYVSNDLWHLDMPLQSILYHHQNWQKFTGYSWCILDSLILCYIHWLYWAILGYINWPYPIDSLDIHPQRSPAAKSPRNGDRAERRGVDQRRAAAHVAAVQRAVTTPWRWDETAITDDTLW